MKTRIKKFLRDRVIDQMFDFGLWNFWRDFRTGSSYLMASGWCYRPQRPSDSGIQNGIYMLFSFKQFCLKRVKLHCQPLLRLTNNLEVYKLWVYCHRRHFLIIVPAFHILWINRSNHSKIWSPNDSNLSGKFCQLQLRPNCPFFVSPTTGL